jgi:hypothetical protein
MTEKQNQSTKKIPLQYGLAGLDLMYLEMGVHMTGEEKMQDQNC